MVSWEGDTRAKLEEMREGIERDVRKFRELLDVQRTDRTATGRFAAIAS